MPPLQTHDARPPAILYRHEEPGHTLGSGLHYDAAALRAGFWEWGTVGDNRKAPHMMLRLNRDAATLTLALDRKSTEAEASRLASRVASALGWPVAQLHTARHKEAFYGAIEPPNAVRPLLPGQARLRLDLSGLPEALGATAKEAPPLVVRCPDASWVDSEPAATGRDIHSRSLFFKTGGGLTSLEVDYGISPARFWGLTASIVAWLSVPFAAVFLAAVFLRRRGAPFTSKSLGHAGWAVSAVGSTVVLFASLPGAAATVKTMAPADLAVPMWGFTAIPFFLCAYLSALAIQIARFRAFPPPHGAKNWPEALRLPLLLTGLALSAGIGLPAWALFGNTHPLVAGVLIGLPIIAAGLNGLVWQARRMTTRRQPTSK